MDLAIKILIIWCLAGLAIVISVWAFAALLRLIGATLVMIAEWLENR